MATGSQYNPGGLHELTTAPISTVAHQSSMNQQFTHQLELLAHQSVLTQQFLAGTDRDTTAHQSSMTQHFLSVGAT